MINNAGIMGVQTRKLTRDGFETHLGVNHLGHFYLNHLLWDKIKKSDDARVISLSSIAHRRVTGMNFDDMNLEKYPHPQVAYGYSKLANMYYIRELQKRLDDKGVNNVLGISLHPGGVRTDLADPYFDKPWKKYLLKPVIAIGLYPLLWLIMKSTSEGAQTSLYACFEDKNKLAKGQYYADCQEDKGIKDYCRDMKQTRRLWEKSEEMLGIKFDI